MMAAYNRNARESAKNFSCAAATSAVARLSGYLLFAGLLCGFAWSCPARAASVIADLAQAVSLNANGTVAFQGSSVTDSNSFSAPFAGADPQAGPSASTTTPLTTLLPTTGNPKDKAEGSMGVLMEFGVPVPGAFQPQDTITFTAFAEASALNAQNSAGQNSNAQVFLEGSAEFSSDPNGTLFFPPNTLVATMKVLNTFVPDPFETGEVRVFQDGVPVAFQSIGAGDVIVPILASHVYLLRVQDEFDVPFGVDPVLNRTIIATITAIPEPSSLALGAMHLIGLLTYGWRRRRGACETAACQQPSHRFFRRS